MAVQAQYSSNTRSAVIDEGNDYPSLQSQSILNIAAVWNKKRPREEVMHRQSHEIQLFLQSQVEQLRRNLLERRQRQYCAAEEWARRRLREKEEEAEKGARRNAELEARAAQVRREVQVWQARAMAQEAEAAALQAEVQRAVLSGGGADDAESGCVSDIGCRACKRLQMATVVMLPCRHLSVFCRDCDPVLQACPRCLSFPSSTIQVFLF